MYRHNKEQSRGLRAWQPRPTRQCWQYIQRELYTLIYDGLNEWYNMCHFRDRRVDRHLIASIAIMESAKPVHPFNYVDATFDAFKPHHLCDLLYHIREATRLEQFAPYNVYSWGRSVVYTLSLCRRTINWQDNIIPYI